MNKIYRAGRRWAVAILLLMTGSLAHAATAIDDTYSVGSLSGDQKLIVTENDQLDYSTSEAAQHIRIVSVTPLSNVEAGSVSIAPDQLSIIYSAPGYPITGETDTFQYTVEDIRGQSTATVTLHIDSSAPVLQATDDKYQTYGDPILLDPMGNDNYPSNEPYQISVTSPSVGTLTRLTDKDSRPIYQYTPPAGLTAATDVTFGYTLDFGSYGKTSASITIHIDPNGNPIVAGLQDGEARDLATALQIACDANSAGILQATNTQFKQTCDTLSSLDLSQRSAAIDQIMLRQVGTQGNTVLQLSASQLTNIRGRLQQLRSGVSGLSVSGLNAQINGQSLALGRLLQGADATGGGAGSEILNSGRLGLFVNGTLTLGSRDHTGNYGGYDFHNQNLTLGADYRITDKTIVGLATGYASARSNASQGDTHLDSDTWNLSLYGNYYPTSIWYVDWVLGYGHSNMDSRRAVDFGTLTSTSTGSTQGSQWNAALDSGVDVEVRGFQVGGQIGAEYRAARVDGYTEHNTAGLDLIVGMQRSEAVTGSIGTHVSKAFGLSEGVVIPQLDLTWNKALKRDTHAVTAKLAILPQAGNFSIQTPSEDSDYYDLGLSVTGVFPHGYSGFMRYGTELGHADYTVSTWELGGRMELSGDWRGFPKFGGEPGQSVATGLFVSTVGPGLSLTFPLYGESLNIRGLVSQMPYSTSRALDGVKYDVNLHLQDYAALLDWYPFAGKFHLTTGVFAHRTWANGTATPTQPVDLGGTTFTPAQVGILHADIEYPHSAAPYLGIGWGNPVAPKAHWTFNADIGVMLTEQPRASLSADSPAAQADPALKLQLDNALHQEEQNINNGSLSHFRFWPLLSVGVGYQF